MQKIKIYWTIFTAFFVLGGLLWRIWQLQVVPLHDWDESIYAQVARETRSATPYYNGAQWFEKPPLPFFILKLSTRLFGETPLVQRSVAMCIAIMALFLVSRIVWRKYPHSAIHLLIPFVLLSSHLFLDRSSLVNVDIYLAAGWLWYIAFPQHRIRVIGVLLGVWSKSFLGFVPVCIDIGYRLFTRTITKTYLRDTLVAIALALVWHGLMYAQYGNLFLQEHIYDHLIARITTPIELHFGGVLFYPTRLWEDFSIFFVGGLLGSLLVVYTSLRAKAKWYTQLQRTIQDRRTYPVLLAATTTLAYSTFLTVTKAKLHWYLTPLLPLLAISLAPILYTVRARSVVYICIVFYALWRYMPQTYLFQTNRYTPPAKVLLAQCIRQHHVSYDHLLLLVSPTDREDARIMEAAKLTIGSTWRYGGSPALLYALNHIPTHIAYTIEIFNRSLSMSGSQLIVAHHSDTAHVPHAARELCKVEDWVAYVYK